MEVQRCLVCTALPGLKMWSIPSFSADELCRKQTLPPRPDLDMS